MNVNVEPQLVKDSASDKAQTAADLLLPLFQKSILKQAKFQALTQDLGSVEGKCCLDLGADNGVISYLLRKRGGTWYSGDLSVETVEAIRSLVTERVAVVAGDSLPYEDQQFDVVVVVDMLEHVEDDAKFIKELFRVLRKDGLLVVNTPNLKRFSALRAFRHIIGQTDAAHGHLRPGYSFQDLHQLCGKFFEIEHSYTYSRFFSEAIDTAIVSGVKMLSMFAGGASNQNGEAPAAEGNVSKGLVVTEQEMKKFRKQFALYSKIYPLLWLVSKIDCLIPFVPGFMRLAVLKRR